jgi:hypothetical protein
MGDAERCREKADECRTMAQQTRDPEIKQQLHRLARDWEQLAQWIEKAATDD